MIETITEIRYIQKLPVHKSSKTTENYTNVSTKSLQNIKSQFDDLKLYFFMFVQEINTAIYGTKPAEVCCICACLWLV